MAQPELTQEVLDERIAILKRFRQLLEEQRRKFRDYLVVLEKQEEAIERDDVDVMVSHAELEQSIISEIYTIQKVIDPFEQLYRDVHPGVPEAEIPKLQTDLETLKTQVLQQNEKNRELLKTHMQALRQKVAGINNPYANRASVYASDKHSASIIDIQQ